jgi:hypothetical protein
MKLAAGLTIGLCTLACLALWGVSALNYSDSAAIGTYQLTNEDESSTLILKSDHTFVQERIAAGKTEHANGSWRRLGEGGLAFSREFLVVDGQEPGADGTRYGDLHKDFGLRVSIQPSQYHVLWYGKTGPSADEKLTGDYTGDEPGVSATLSMKSDHSFEQTVSSSGNARHAQGAWKLNQQGDIEFSRAFLKASGEPLSADETASAWDPKGSNLQIKISRTSKSGAPVFRKPLLLW